VRNKLLDIATSPTYRLTNIKIKTSFYLLSLAVRKMREEYEAKQKTPLVPWAEFEELAIRHNVEKNEVQEVQLVSYRYVIVFFFHVYLTACRQQISSPGSGS
jgi:hypothetical protein